MAARLCLIEGIAMSRKWVKITLVVFLVLLPI